MSLNFNRFNKISDYVAGLNIDNVKKEYGLKKVIKLASNENPFPIPFKYRRKIKNYLPDVRLYPDMEYKSLRSKLADSLGLVFDELIVGNGSDEIFDIVFKAFFNSNSKIIIPSPSFAIYKILATIYNVKTTILPFDDKNNFSFPINKLIGLMSKDISAVILCNPNNPTGTYINNSDLLKIIEKLSSNTLLLIDEAYFNFSDNKDFPDNVSIFKKYRKKNIVVFRTFSKLYGIAGLRLGYAFSNKNIIKVLNKVRMPFNVNLLADKTAQLLLNDKNYIDKVYNKILENKFFLYKELSKLGIKYIPSQTNFVLIKLKITGKEVFNKLLRKGIIVRSYNDELLKNYIRVTIGTRKEMIKFVKELKKVIS